MTSTDLSSGYDGFDVVAGCDTGGGGGGKGGKIPPDTTNPPADDVSRDYDPNMTPPDCTKPVLLDWEHAYCNSRVPSGERLARTDSALQRIAQRGGECANIAAFAQSLLNSGRLRYFQHEESIHGVYGGWGSPDLGALLGGFWVDDFGGTATGAPNFDNKLVHEVEHAMGRAHFPDGNSDQTPNSLACSGL